MKFTRLGLFQSSATFLFALTAVPIVSATDVREAVKSKVDAEYAALEKIHKHLHANPELSFMETNTATLVAKELRALGIEVTEKVGNTGVVGVLRNGAGPTVLVRADMDGLPVKELTTLSWASQALVKDLSGKEQPAMHACGHDLHVTGLIGTARTLVGFAVGSQSTSWPRSRSPRSSGISCTPSS